ncbi:YdeI/OmpD-associated family protein [Macrococcoides caseolyticum]|uniref:YdeI/OmpD-associated family protein n=1 Tax=Macrococcoides caseolyticum TaxID=69966 RepID=UPI001F3602E1|nr:YdeI/OmpD-associated family protein [Macrococcus caseolyticus]MCE4956542.1 YdeI/OmpD-associated family protein [Macrococcus caseolyticus]
MTGLTTEQKLEKYFNKASQWQFAYILLRNIIKEYDLDEEYKWMHPCYTLKGKNVVLIHGFKDYVALLFHKGVLLEDKYNLLIQQTEHVQVDRQLRFSSIEEIEEKADKIRYYIEEAIRIEKSGKKLPKKNHKPLEIPVELEESFNNNERLRDAFYNLTPGRQRAYVIEINRAKRSETRRNRIEKYTEKIYQGKGLLE